MLTERNGKSANTEKRFATASAVTLMAIPTRVNSVREYWYIRYEQY